MPCSCSHRGCGSSVAAPPAKEPPTTQAPPAKEPPTSQAPVTGPVRPDIAKAFAQFDVDGNGTLEKSELQRAFRAIGFKKVEVTDELFASFDFDGNGHVTLHEFDVNLKDKTRTAIEEKLKTGFVFDKEK